MCVCVCVCGNRYKTFPMIRHYNGIGDVYNIKLWSVRVAIVAVEINNTFSLYC